MNGGAADIIGAGLGPLAWQRDFRFDDWELAKLAGGLLPVRVGDLLDIAVACYLIDRLVLRHPTEEGPPDGSRWERDLSFTVPVRDPGFWRAPEVAVALRELLTWLTDDDWHIEFCSKGSGRRYGEQQEALMTGAPAQAYGLFSGGLDSLLGAALDLRTEPGPLALVSVATNERLRTLQRKLVRKLQPHGELRWGCVDLALTRGCLRRNQRSRREIETSQRTRGLVFLSAGAAAAIAGRTDELRVYENGPGAINLPMSRAQRGSQSTRAMHPKTLRLAERLFSLVAGRSFTVVNRRFWTTKAEMCDSASAATLSLIPESVSCDTGLTSRRSQGLCGHCTSCLLRRQALQAAGLDWADASDCSRMRVDVRDLPSRKSIELHWMLEQAARLSGAVRATQPETALLREYPQLGSVLEVTASDQRPRVMRGLVELYARYVAEWHAFDSPLVRRYLPEAGNQR